MNKMQSINLITAVIEEMNTMLPLEKHVNTQSDDCIKDLDSLQLVNLIVALEERIEEDFGKEIIFSLEGQGAEISFLESIDALSTYILNSLTDT